MWKLKVAEGGRWVRSVNNHVGRQHWEFDANAGTPEERAEVERLRHLFTSNRFINKQSSDALMRLQNEDGGWGLHIEGHSTMYCSTLNYVALRLLGEEPNGSDVSRGRKWILDHGGATGAPLFGKFWLAVLGVYEWDGLNPIPPELLLLPRFSLIHPEKMSCYCRSAYIPMSYIYAKRFVGQITPLVQQLRHELYQEPYHKINWNLARNACIEEDIYRRHPVILDMLWGYLYHVEKPVLKSWPVSKLREKAMKIAMEHIHYDDINSSYFTSGCVGKMLSMIACWIDDPNSEAYKSHLDRIPDYFWIAEDGLKIQSLGSQTWDATFAIQAIMSSNLAEDYGDTLRKAYSFVKLSQIGENLPGSFKKKYRHISKGSWTFSTLDHGLPVSDCTAEGLKVTLMCSQMPEELVGEKMETERLYNAVDFLLTYQSKNGGFPAWEPRRAYNWLEKFNPIDFVGDVLIEREYVECTSSVIQGLSFFKKVHPIYRKLEIENCIKRAHQYILDEQKPDGSWFGHWGICFTYGTWFAVDALVLCGGMNYNNSFSLRRACDFLLSKKLPNGGWGESYLSYTTQEYTNIEETQSNLVQTSWALLALIKVGQMGIDPTPIKKAVRLLINSQVEEDGDFLQKEITGASFRSCTLHYAAHRNIFPIWALGEYRKYIVSMEQMLEG